MTYELTILCILLLWINPGKIKFSIILHKGPLGLRATVGAACAMWLWGTSGVLRGCLNSWTSHRPALVLLIWEYYVLYNFEVIVRWTNFESHRQELMDGRSGPQWAAGSFRSCRVLQGTYGCFRGGLPARRATYNTDLFGHFTLYAYARNFLAEVTIFL
jgi:hypothetical protein